VHVKEQDEQKKGLKNMLILTRRISEALCIGDNVKVTVLAVHGNQVRIGIDAPREIDVHREEIFYKIMREREVAMHE